MKKDGDFMYRRNVVLLIVFFLRQGYGSEGMIRLNQINAAIPLPGADFYRESGTSSARTPGQVGHAFVRLLWR
jgi:hypothetical protein